MNTPLTNAIRQLVEQDFSRFHTPGHKGRELDLLSPVTPYDLTEVRGADSLYSPDGPITEMERLYTGLYRTGGSFLSAGGSTLCIQAMLRLVRPAGEKGHPWPERPFLRHFSPGPAGDGPGVALPRHRPRPTARAHHP